VKAAAAETRLQRLWLWFFTAGFGCLLGLSLLKFGNPIILDRLIDPPANIWEFFFQPWPVRWGYALLIGCSALGFGVVQFRTQVPRWVLVVPCAWLGWQILASAQSIDMRLTHATLLHFCACVLCFFLGLFGLGKLKSLNCFWFCLVLAFAFALWTGFEQHYGGLEATRKMFYQQADWQHYSPDYIKKIESNRIFSTLVYPNALAAAILLLGPALLVAAWTLSARLTNVSRLVIVGVLAYAAIACLYWSGSKSGWLICLVVLMAALLKQHLSKPAKMIILATMLLVGLAGFSVKYASYFRRGATSVSARFDYWRAAYRTALEHPILGTGPGTFSVAYRTIRPAGAEMAQLAHNDYLEQASDSGVVGLLSYSIFILGSVILLGRAGWTSSRRECFAVWLGLLGWSLQSFVEFLLYVPGLAWPAFTLFGWLWAISSEEQ
jgi:O-antigen ligase